METKLRPLSWTLLKFNLREGVKGTDMILRYRVLSL